MFEAFVNNKCIEKHRNEYSVFPLHFFVMIMILCCNSFKLYSQNNIAKFDINDPRNPDCPCHKRQKLAEDEYARMNSVSLNNEKNNFNELREKKDQVNNARTKNTFLKSGIVKQLKKVRKINFYFEKLKFRIIRKAHISKKTHPDYSVCYKW
jgi:hypothetical protein